MNRLQTAQIAALPGWSTELSRCETGRFPAAAEAATHALFAPLHYEANYGYPLLVWLHGSGDSERQLRRIMPHVSLRNYAAVAPRGTMQMSPPARESDVNSQTAAEESPHQRVPGYRWVQSPQHIAQAEQRVSAAIAAAREKFNIREDRIFLAGYECGGSMAFRIAMQNPDQFAGVLSLCGGFSRDHAPLANLDAIRQLPLFVASCRQGTYYPSEQVCDDLRLFHAAGMSITLREYPGEDGLSIATLADIDRWIMEQIIAPPPAVSDIAKRAKQA
ncbi:MAG TPA: dienelactone hydrolase family protein [Pirellulales bacterium]